jgi:hypothetical protein
MVAAKSLQGHSHGFTRAQGITRCPENSSPNSFVCTFSEHPLPRKADALDKVLESGIEPQAVEGRVEKFE